MTNGEKLKEIFLYLESDDTDLVKVLNIDNLKSWWNAEYKEPTKHVCKAEDCRSLKDIKEMIERKAKELDGKVLDAGGVCIGLYFAIANDLPSVYPKIDKPIKDLIRQMKSEIADSLEFWDYSPNNNPLARDILETVNTYCVKMVKSPESGDKE